MTTSNKYYNYDEEFEPLPDGKLSAMPSMSSVEAYECDSGFNFDPYLCYLRNLVARDRESKGMRKKYDPCCYCPIIRIWLENNEEERKKFDMKKSSLSKKIIENDIENFDWTKPKAKRGKTPKGEGSAKKAELDLSEGKYAVRPSIETKTSNEKKETSKPNEYANVALKCQIEILKLKQQMLTMELEYINKVIEKISKMLY